MSGGPGDEKICASCGRRFAWRPRWARAWPGVRYCSKACQQRRVGARGRALEEGLLALLAARSPGASACPSEVARAEGGERWRELMEPARRAARRLAARGLVVITQRGREVDPSAARGPIRVARGSRFGSRSAKEG